MENLKPAPTKGLALLVLTGASLGALVGLYVGLSTSPIVSTIVGTLTSLLTTLVGLKLIMDKTEPSEGGEDFDSFKIKMVLLSTFSISCILFTLTGIYLRTHNTLAPELSAKSLYWQKAGFSKEETKKILLFQELGIQTGKDGINGENGITAISDVKESAMAHSSVLFSAEVDVSSCELLSSVSADQSLNVILDNFTSNGGIWENWANAINQKMPQNSKKNALLALKESVCAGSSFVISDEECETLKGVKTATSMAEIKKSIDNKNPFWNSLYQKAGVYFKGNEPQQVLFIQTIASTVCSL